MPYFLLGPMGFVFNWEGQGWRSVNSLLVDYCR